MNFIGLDLDKEITQIAKLNNKGEVISLKTINFSNVKELYNDSIKAFLCVNLCNKKILLPGIIDVHSHLRDLGQSEKEIFITGTKAAAASGITTVFTMPNTSPPSISAERIKNWMRVAKDNLYVDVGFIAGVPADLNEIEFEKIVNQHAKL